ncbi:hypothetical protein NDU88_011236, partial [Pleurodeles waltl]
GGPLSSLLSLSSCVVSWKRRDYREENRADAPRGRGRGRGTGVQKDRAERERQKLHSERCRDRTAQPERPPQAETPAEPLPGR